MGTERRAPALPPIWSVEKELQTQAMSPAADLQDLLREIDNELPVPARHHAYVEGPLFRLPGSHRTIYRSLGDRPGGRGVLAFKGVEPLAPCYTDLLSDLRRRCYTAHSIAQHLVVEEGKIPGCMSVDEALAEAEASASVQRRHSALYGEAARVPFALRVYELPGSVVQAVEHEVVEMLEPPAQRRLHSLLSSGLGVLVYHYPTPPIRVRDLDTLLPVEFRARQLALAQLLDVDVLVRGWVDLFARLLVLGLLPGGLASIHTGLCCQPQNACIDGGFVDLDSVVEIDRRGATAREMTDALSVSLRGLVDSVLTLLGCAEDHPSQWVAEFTRGRVQRWVESLLEEAVVREEGDGRTVPQEIRRLLKEPASYVTVIEELTVLHDFPHHAARTAAADFGPFGRTLLAAALGHDPADRSSGARASSGPHTVPDPQADM